MSTPLVPLRMLNEVAYCPRLFALEWMNNEWADSADTVDGRTVHRRVDRPSKVSLEPPPPDPDRPRVVRSLDLGDPELGLIGKIDLVEVHGDEVVPIDYKRGHPAPTPEGAWEPERVQVCAQALLLRANGYRCERGVLYFAAARRRVEVTLTDALIEATLRYRDEAVAVMLEGRLPPPLVDSPKCPRCSLVGICLPDEHNRLAHGSGEVRPMIPPRDDGVPLYVQLQGGRLGKRHDELVVTDRTGGVVGSARMEDTTRVVLWGNVTVSAPVLHELAARDVPVAFHGYGGWFHGMFTPASGRNVLTRMAQHRAAADPTRSLRLARAFIASKIANSRVLLRRNAPDADPDVLVRLKELVGSARGARSNETLMGIEGGAARLYFSQLSAMLKGGAIGTFDFESRSRRPPKDPVNALLSFVYACLAREITTTLHGVGLDPFVGFLHQPRPGRPALALDLMEEFRPVIADSVVINAVNNGVVQEGDFTDRGTGVALNDAARKRLIEVYERRLDELATHPVLGTRLSYRRILEVQARLLGKTLLDELPAYPEYRIR